MVIPKIVELEKLIIQFQQAKIHSFYQNFACKISALETHLENRVKGGSTLD